jgi:hypothetical protein
MNKYTIQKLAGTVLFGLGIATVCFAAAVNPVNSAPEIDAASAMNALTLLTGALLIIRGRKR